MTETKVSASLKKAMRELSNYNEEKKRAEEKRKETRRKAAAKRRKMQKKQQKLNAAVGSLFLDSAEGKGDFAAFQYRSVVELRDAIVRALETEEDASSVSPGTEGGESAEAQQGDADSQPNDSDSYPEGD